MTNIPVGFTFCHLSPPSCRLQSLRVGRPVLRRREAGDLLTVEDAVFHLCAEIRYDVGYEPDT
jgi:hypothetical protein